MKYASALLAMGLFVASIPLANAQSIPSVPSRTFTAGTQVSIPPFGRASGDNSSNPYEYFLATSNALRNPNRIVLGNLFPGLTFNATTRLVSGTPRQGVSQTVLHYHAARRNASNGRREATSRPFSYTVNGPRFDSSPSQTAKIYTSGEAITSISFPAASGSPDYDVVGPGNAALADTIPGLSFDTTSRTLSGTPTRGAAAVLLTYNATAGSGRAFEAFSVTVNGPIFAPAPVLPDDQLYATGHAITQLVFPTASGSPVYALVDSAGNAVGGASNPVPGLSFNPATQTLTGTPTAEGTTSITYTATASAITASAVFTITVADFILAAPPLAGGYTVATPLSITLPAAINSEGAVVYTLTGADPLLPNDGLPAGLIFTANTTIGAATGGVLSGNADNVNDYRLTYTATDSASTPAMASVTFTLRVINLLTLAFDDVLPTIPAEFATGAAIDALTFPTSSGNNPTYSLKYNNGTTLPPGLVFNPTARTLTGTPTRAGSYTLTYRATDDSSPPNMVDSAPFTINVRGLYFADFQAPPTGTAGTAINFPFADALGVDAEDISYTLAGDSGGSLPAGLTFDAATKTLSGAPQSGSNQDVELIYRATDSANPPNTAQATFAFGIFGPIFDAAPANQAFPGNDSINSSPFPTASGSGTRTYAVIGPGDATLAETIPDLSFDASSRRLTGTPIANGPNSLGTTSLTYTATDNDGVASAFFTVQIQPGHGLPNPGNFTFVLGTDVSEDFPQINTTNTNRDAFVHTITGSLPPDLSFNSQTRRLTGTAMPSGTYSLTYRANASSVTRFADFTIFVEPGLVAPPDQTYRAGVAITPLTLSMAVDERTYQVTPSGSFSGGVGSVIPGLNFNANTRVLSGTPLRGSAEQRLFYRATTLTTPRNRLDRSFEITVLGPIFHSLPGDRSFTANSPITDLTFPASTGNGTLTYHLTGANGDTNLATEVPGLSFDGGTSGTRRLTGTPTAVARTRLTYTARDDDGVSSAFFTLTIGSDFVLPDIAGTYATGSTIAALTFPTFSGNNVQYSMTYNDGEELPEGLMFDPDPDARTLSGRPTRAGSYLLTYRAMNDSATDNMRDGTFTMNVSGLYFNGGLPVFRATAGTEINPPYRFDRLALGADADDISYTLTGPALPGLTFDPDARTLSGTPTEGDLLVSLTYTATDLATPPNTGRIFISGNIIGPDFDGASPTAIDLNLTAGLAVTETLPGAVDGSGLPSTLSLTDSAGNALGAAVDNPIPGLSFDSSNRMIAGTPSRAIAADITLTYTARSNQGVSMGFVTISIAGPVFNFTSGEPAPADQNFLVDEPSITPQFPAAIGVATYDLLEDGVPVGSDATSGPIPGMIYNSARLLQGTPTAIGDYSLTYTATDADGAVSSLFFTVTVSAFSVSAPADLAAGGHTVGVPLSLDFAIATGGDSPISYTLFGAGASAGDDALPPGLTFTADPNPAANSTGVLSGTPETIGDYPLTYRATDSASTPAVADATFTLSVVDLAFDAVLPTIAAEFATGDAIDAITFPTSSGNNPTYSLIYSGGTDLPAGLTFNPTAIAADGATPAIAARTLTGTPTRAGSYTLTYRATDDSSPPNMVDSDAFDITVAGLYFAADLPAIPSAFAAGSAVVDFPSLPAALGADAEDISYTLTGDSGGSLPAGLAFDEQNRRLTGTPNQGGSHSLTYLASDNITPPAMANTAAATFALTISGPVFDATPALPVDMSLPSGSTITAIALPAATVASPATGSPIYALTDSAGNTLAAATDSAATSPIPGLIFDAASRTLSGTPLRAAADPVALTYTATATGPSASPGVTSAVFAITITGPVFTSLPIDQTFILNRAIDPAVVLPAASGSPSYVLRDSALGSINSTGTNSRLPGLMFNAASRTLSGTPTLLTADGGVTLNYNAIDAGVGSSVSSFTVTVTDFSVSAPSLAADGYTVRMPLALTFGTATGGDSPISYTLFGAGASAGDDALPPGLDFTANSTGGVLTGTPETISDYPLTYRATDSASTPAVADARFTLRIVRPFFHTENPADIPLADQTYAAGQPISESLAMVLPRAHDPTAEANPPRPTLVYTLTGDHPTTADGLPPGLGFDADARRLTGTPTFAAAAITLIYRAADAFGNTSEDVPLSVTIAGPVFIPPVPQNYFVRQMVGFTLPEAGDNGGGAITYNLTGPGSSHTAAGAARNLPAGLTFYPNGDSAADPAIAARTLTGMPSAAGDFALTYTATDTDAADAARISTATFTATVNPAATFIDLPGDSTEFDFLVGETINQTLPEIMSAAAGVTVVYMLTASTADGTPSAVDGSATSALPGLSFDATNRTLSGAATAATAGAVTLAYTATAGDDSADREYSAAVRWARFDRPIVNLTLPAGVEVDRPLPAAEIAPGALVAYNLVGVGGASTAIDAARNLPPGLSFTTEGPFTNNAATVGSAGAPGTGSIAIGGQLVGTPTAAASATLTYYATVTLADPGGSDSASQTFTITINFGFVGGLPGNITYPLGVEIDPLTFPTAAGGDAISYTLSGDYAATGAAASMNGLPPGLSFTAAAIPAAGDQTAIPARSLYGTPTESAAVSVTYIAAAAADSSIPAAEHTFTITIGGGGAALTAVNQVVLPEVARAITASANLAISRRISRVNSGGLGRNSAAFGGNSGGLGGQTATFALGGQTTVATALATHGNPMLVDKADPKTMLAGSSFSIPLNSGGGFSPSTENHTGAGGANLSLAPTAEFDAGGTAGDLAGNSASVLAANAAGLSADSAGGSSIPITFWGSGEYREMSGAAGDQNDLEWSGELSGFHLGLDAQVRPGLLLGLAASRLRSAIDYGATAAAAGGSHDLDITTISPYLGWHAGGVDLWATLRYGEGDLDISPDDAARAAAEVDMRAAGIGASGALWQNAAARLRLKSELSRSELAVQGGGDLVAMQSASTRLRLSLEADYRRQTAGGGVLAPTLELGLRYDGGDGNPGAAAEIGAGLRYRSRAGHTADGKFRVVARPGAYREWGIQGTVTIATAADGQGLSLQISPAYGRTDSEIQQLWQAGVGSGSGSGSGSQSADHATPHNAATAATATTDPANPANYRPRLDSRLAYGIPLKTHGGMLTPYGEITLTDAADRHRLGINWQTPGKFHLNLVGERQQTTAASTTILLQGKMQF